MKAEGIGSWIMMLRSKKLSIYNVGFIAFVGVIIILLPADIQGCNFFSSKWSCKVYKGRHFIMMVEKRGYLEGQVITMAKCGNKRGKIKVNFANVTEV